MARSNPTSNAADRAAAQAAGRAAQEYDKLGKAADQLSRAQSGLYRSLEQTATAARRAGIGLAGFVTAGLRGTAEAGAFQAGLTRVNREIAGVFAPQINNAIRLVNRLAESLRSMTGNQQQSIREFVTGGVALAGFVTIVTRATAALAAARKAQSVLVAANAARGMATAAPGRLAGVGAVLPAVGLGVLGLAAASEKGREALGRLFTAVAPLANAMGDLIDGLMPAIKWLANFAAGLVDAVASLVKWTKEVGASIGEWITGDKKRAAQLAAISQQDLERMVERGRQYASGERRATTSDEMKESMQRKMDMRLLEGELERRRTEAAGEAERKRTSVTPRAGGPEDPRNVINRLQAAVGGMDSGARTAKATEQSASFLKMIHDRIMAMINGIRATPPPVAP